MRKVARLLAVCCVALASGACSRPLDGPGVESQITTQLGERFAGSTWTVTCPDDVEPKAGDTFECSAASDQDQVFAIEVTQANAQGSLIWRITGTG